MRGAELRTLWPRLSPCAVFTLAPACSHHNTGEKVRCTFILHWFRIVLPAGCVYSRYICINDHLMHGLQQGYFASGYKPSTSIWINCEMHLLANIQITLLQILLHNSAFLPWWNVIMCPAAAACVALPWWPWWQLSPARVFVTIAPVSLCPAPHSRGWLCGLPGTEQPRADQQLLSWGHVTALGEDTA